jgi:hypothetical protein
MGNLGAMSLRSKLPLSDLAALVALSGSGFGVDSLSFVLTFVKGQVYIRPLNARLSRGEVALILRTSVDGVSYLVAEGLLKSLGSDSEGKQLFFSSLELLAKMQDLKWLNKLTDALRKFSEKRNGSGNVEPGSRQ